MKNSIKCIAALFLLCISFTALAQISFCDNTFLLSEEDHYSGVSMGIIDMNGDGLDDIVRQNFGTGLNIELQSQPGQKFTRIAGPETGAESQWAMCMADINNNGRNEIMTGGVNNEILIVKMQADGTTLNMEVLEASNNIFVQGSNFADINNDGFVDIFVCHDNGESRIWRNDGLGNFIPSDDWIDMSIEGDSGEPASGNYGSTWVDIDNDGDTDLYIAKCRQGVVDVNDKRRINQLYINDGTENFTEDAANRGLAVSWQSWTADFQDINNDGWLDCFITNHDHTSQMFLNDGTGHFSELQKTGITIQGLPIQGLMRDLDNDGWVDVITTGTSGQVFRNNGDLTFTEVLNLFDDNRMESLAMGDLNNDGYQDIYGGYAVIFNNPSKVNDKLWINNGGDNNYVAVTLQGEESNRNAIGARVELYGEWGIQVREVRSGESYGISNSNISYFGIGQSESIDSIVVRWPSGLVQTEYKIEVNNKAKIVEGKCLGRSPEITTSGPTSFCLGEEVTLTAEVGFESYQWTSGAEDLSLTVANSGNYSLEVVDSLGCIGFSKNINITVDPVLYPIIKTGGNTEVCAYDMVTFEMLNVNVNEEDIVWSDGSIGYFLEIETSGIYNATVTGLCSDFESDTVEIVVYDNPNMPEATGDSILLGETAKLTAVGDNLAWFNSETTNNAIGFGDSIEIEGVTTNTSFFVADRTGSGIVAHVGMKDHEGTLYSENTGIIGSLIFDVLTPITLDSVKVYTDLAGLRKIRVQDPFFNEVASALIDIPVGESTIYLGFDIPVGQDYSILTDFFQNLETTGEYSPRLQRSSENIGFPYIVEDVVSIKEPGFGQDFYYYFYDWSISAGVLCASERTEVQVKVDPFLSAPIEDFNEILVYPNPSTGKFSIRILDDLSHHVTWKIVDATGKLRYQNNESLENAVALDLDLNAGLYILHIQDGTKTYKKKIIVQ